MNDEFFVRIERKKIDQAPSVPPFFFPKLTPILPQAKIFSS
jgi:hypothetical protein